MNKKQRYNGSIGCLNNVVSYLDNLNTVREVSSTFFAKEWTTSVRMKSSSITSRYLKIVLLKKHSKIKSLDLSNCMNLNVRCLNELLQHFTSLRILILNNCHSLINLPQPHLGLHVSVENLWRVYDCRTKFTPDETIRIIVNCFNYLSMNCCCHTKNGKLCLRKLKDFCGVNSSLLVYVMDCFLYHLSPVEYTVNDYFQTENNVCVFLLTFNSEYGYQKIDMTLQMNTEGLWRLVDFWSRA